MKPNENSVQVWDAFIRVFHWTLVGSVIGMYLSGDDFEKVHATLGYFVICLVSARILWGFLGSSHARFSDFVCSPAAVGDYVKGLVKGHPKHYIGHNPAGGLMIVIMLIALLFTAFTGLKALATEGRGPLAGLGRSLVREAHADQDGHKKSKEERAHGKAALRKGDGSGIWKDIHEAMTGFFLFLVVAHIGGVAVSSLIHRENLIAAMITGKKTAR